MVLRVNDPDKLYKSGTMAAAKAAEKRFRAPVSDPRGKTRMVNTASLGLGPKRVTSQVSTPEKPELISHETNPNMDWRTAQAINVARTKGHQAQVLGVQNAQAELDQGAQRGQFQLGVQSLSNKGAMGRTVRTGQDALQRAQVGEQGANARLGIANQFTANEAERAGAREMERLGVANQYNQQSQQLGIAGNAFLSGVPANDAQGMANAPAGSPLFSGEVKQKQSGSYKHIPGKLGTAPGTGYTQYPMTAGPDGKAVPDYDAVPYSTLVKLPRDQQKEVLTGQGLDAADIDKFFQELDQGK